MVMTESSIDDLLKRAVQSAVRECLPGLMKEALAEVGSASPASKASVAGRSVLTEAELCVRWRRTRNFLLKQRKAGRLPFVRFGAAVRYSLDVIERIEREGVPADAAPKRKPRLVARREVFGDGP